jgi:hypothetical protein
MSLGSETTVTGGLLRLPSSFTMLPMFDVGPVSTIFICQCYIGYSQKFLDAAYQRYGGIARRIFCPASKPPSIDGVIVESPTKHQLHRQTILAVQIIAHAPLTKTCTSSNLVFASPTPVFQILWNQEDIGYVSRRTRRDLN